jgi:hypothetical protein
MSFNQQTHLPDGEPLNPDYNCMMDECSWWNERFGMCCIAVDAYQRGIEDRRKEFKDK